MPDKKPEIWQAQEWVRVAPLDEVREFLGWARAIVEMRGEAQPKRKKRSDAGQSRTLDLQEPKK